MLKKAHKSSIEPVITENSLVQLVEKGLLGVFITAMIIVFIAAKNTHTHWIPPKEHNTPGSPLKASPYFEKPPPEGTTADIFPTETTSSSHLTQPKSVQKDRVLTSRREIALISAKAYLTLLEHTDEEKHGLLKALAAESTALRNALIGPEELANAPILPSESGLTDHHETEIGASFDAVLDRLSSNLEQSMPPPTCVELNASYIAHLAALRDLLTAVAELTKQASPEKSNGEAVAREAVQHAKERLQAETAATDDTLRALCSYLGITKNFDITYDIPN